MGNEEIYSYHTFMFPFKWDIQSDSFMGSIDINKFNEICKKSKWKEAIFEIKSEEEYNEFIYFHDFAQRALFSSKKTCNDKGNDEFPPSYYFEKKEFENKSFELDILCKDWQNNAAYDKKYKLTIDGVSLRVFETGVAILAINLKNFSHRTFEDVLFINDFGRRLYPQFLSKNKDDKNKDLAESAKNTFLPRRIKFADFEDEKFEYFEYKESSTPKISQYIFDILGKDFQYKDFFQPKDSQPKVYIKQLLDDRMFVVSHLMDESKSIEITRNYQKNTDWYKYLFVDSKDLTCQNDEMRLNLINQNTYIRWLSYGTLWGISRYSFVCLSNNSDFSRTVLNQHMRRHYFQMISLVLAIRTSTIRFSDEISKISNMKQDKNNKLQDEISSLYKSYIKFVNRIYFREISPQEQGIELYNQICDVMKIHRDVKDLDDEISELHTYASMLYEKNRNDELEKLSKVATYLMPPTVVFGLFGMNTFGEKFFDKPLYRWLEGNLINSNLGWTIWAVILAILFLILTKFLIEEKK